MMRRWLKLRKRLVGVLLPTLRAVSPRIAARALTGIGQIEHALSGGSRARHDEAVRRWAVHFGGPWDHAAISRSLAGNEVRWQARDLILDGLPDHRLEPLFHVLGRDHLDAALDAGTGAIVLASHYGSHMVPIHWLLRQGYETRVYMERPHHISKYLGKHFADDGPLGQSRLFISRKFTAAESAASIMRAVKVLRAGMCLCLAGDVRWTGPNTAPAWFLGQQYSFTATWVVLAAMTGAPVVPVFCRMTRGGTYRLEYRPAFHVAAEALARRDVASYVQDYLHSVEEQIRTDPANGIEYTNWSSRPSGASIEKAG